jgi:acyl-CoA thioesterase-1
MMTTRRTGRHALELLHLRILLQIGVFAALFHCLLTMHTAPSALADATGRPLRIVAFGDSLTAGFRLAPADAFPVKLEKALGARGHKVQVQNAGVSGDTTAAGLARLDWAVPDAADLVILALGANDALRGIDPAVARRNLEAIITRVKAKGARILLAGMLSPKNWGEDYARRFDAIFPELAQKHGLTLYPFFLEGVALRPELNLDDGLHPNASGVDAIVERMLPVVEGLLRQIASAR